MPKIDDSEPTAALKAEIALQALERDSGVEEIAHKHQVSVDAVVRWQHELQQRAAELFAPDGPSTGLPANLQTSSDISGARVGAVLDSLFMFVGVLELDGTLIQANAAPLAAAAIRAEDVVGKKFWDCYWWDYGAEVRAQVRDVCARAARGEALRYDVPVRMAGDSKMIIDFQIAPLRDSSGRITHLIPSAVDITERKRQEEEIRQRAEEVEKLMDLVPAMVFISRDSECREMTGNRMAMALYEAEPGENLSATASKRRRLLRGGVEIPAAELPMQVATSTGQDVWGEEIDLELPSGRHMSMWGSATPLLDGDGMVRGCISAFVETTERNRVERALRESEEKFRSAFKTSPAVLAISDIEDGRYLEVNDAFERIMGYSREEMLASSSLALGLWPEPERRSALAAQLRREGSLQDVEVTLRAKHGELKTVVLSATMIEMEGEPYVLSSWLDISARKQALEALLEQKQDLETLLDTLPMGVLFAADPQCRLVTGNRAATTLLRMPEGANLAPHAQPQTYQARLEGLEVPPHRWPMMRAARGEIVTDEGLQLLFADGSTAETLVSARPLVDATGSVRGAVGGFLDVTGLKHAELALREADQRKDEFLAVLAHELRNPLAPLRSGLDLLQLAGSDIDVAGRVQGIMQRQLSHLVRLVDDLLDLSRVSQGKIALDLQPLDLHGVIGHAVDVMRPQIADRGHELILELADTPAPLHGDSERLTQVLMNLLTNASKYTEPGGRIFLRTEVTDGHVLVRIKDTGIGIPQKRRAEIFEMFTQLPQPGRHANQGLGIGLSISRQLVSLHGGTISVDSDGPGYGSEFAVRLPLASPPPAVTDAPLDAAAQRPAGLRVLIVDDNADAADSLAMLLELQGHAVSVAYDGATGLEAFCRVLPQLVMLDIGLPDMSGYELAQRIRAKPDGREIRLVAVTGWGQDADKARAMEAGFDAHVTKPIDAQALSRIATG